MKIKLKDINAATGIAIFLVVLGHFARNNELSAHNVLWYRHLKSLIYSFHMPFFMFLSGYIYYYIYHPMNKFSDYIKFAYKKFHRLMIPFFIFAFIVVAGKHIAFYFVSIDGSYNIFYQDVITVLINPLDSNAVFLWYIYILYEFYLFTPILITIFKNNIELLFVLSLLLHILVLFVHSKKGVSFPLSILVNRHFGIYFVFYFFIFFNLGMVLSKHRQCYTKFIDKYKALSIAIFSALIILNILLITIYSYSLPKIIMGLFAIPAIHSIARINLGKLTDLFQFLGKYSFVIYLINLFAITIVKIILLKFTPLDYNEFYIIAVILLFSGLYIPIFVKKYCIKYLPSLDRIIY